MFTRINERQQIKYPIFISPQYIHSRNNLQNIQEMEPKKTGSVRGIKIRSQINLWMRERGNGIFDFLNEIIYRVKKLRIYSSIKYPPS